MQQRERSNRNTTYIIAFIAVCTFILLLVRVVELSLDIWFELSILWMQETLSSKNMESLNNFKFNCFVIGWFLTRETRLWNFCMLVLASGWFDGRWRWGSPYRWNHREDGREVGSSPEPTETPVSDHLPGRRLDMYFILSILYTYFNCTCVRLISCKYSIWIIKD